MTRPADHSAIINLVVAGHSNKEIAWRQGISERTVETHLTRVMKDKGLLSRAQLIILELTGGRPWEV